ncbi:MAG: hypothetical protein ACRD10_12880, partial [Terriglobia bacterium]
MKPRVKIVSQTLLLAVLALVPAGAHPRRGAMNGRLRRLAQRAVNHRGWNALRRYARSAPDREARGLAYFALGYREYESRLYEPAAEDLLRAAQSR